jgi:16S rRNA C967 or C1407 C5-methylase (RsmB/RsmF family)/NOL1/NOP2/fmu family ribosome biogenesis protein
MILPGAFEIRLRERLGNEFANFRDSLLAPPVVSIRLNTNKPFAQHDWRPVPWCETGRYLDERPVFTLDPLLHAGAYYVQEASSMFLEHALKSVADLNKPLRVLDLCAAPGGKSTHLLSLLSPQSLLVSNEVIRSRAAILSENISKWGNANVVVTNNDPTAFQSLGEYFDVILVDAPCSGEGLFRKDQHAIAEWSEDAANLCSLRQRRILNDIWPALKPDGLLIYCTCTYNEKENEKNLSWLSTELAVEFLRLPQQHPGILEVQDNDAIGYQLFPHRVSGEGFFLSVMRKISLETTAPKFRKREPQRPPKDFPKEWLSGDFDGRLLGDLWVAWPKDFTADIILLGEELNVVSRGTAVGTATKNKLVPDHALALSVHLNRANVTEIELDHKQALEYLRKNVAIGDHPLMRDGSRGYALITYKGIGLGWVNRIGNRVNNLYPSGWRIRMA